MYDVKEYLTEYWTSL